MKVGSLHIERFTRLFFYGMIRMKTPFPLGPHEILEVPLEGILPQVLRRLSITKMRGYQRLALHRDREVGPEVAL